MLNTKSNNQLQTFPKNQQNIDSKDESYQIKTIEEPIGRKFLIYGTNKYKYSFQQCKVIRSFGDNILMAKLQ